MVILNAHIHMHCTSFARFCSQRLNIQREHSQHKMQTDHAYASFICMNYIFACLMWLFIVICTDSVLLRFSVLTYLDFVKDIFLE